ncbi:hypothetical protein TNCV_4683631 [Trichonephila clavipes]|nr:hypothetical protein TNCV_4683631 [Trichonephila clavipes]
MSSSAKDQKCKIVSVTENFKFGESRNMALVKATKWCVFYVLEQWSGVSNPNDIPVPLKTRRVGQRCTLNLSRAETSSRWSGDVGGFCGGFLGTARIVITSANILSTPNLFERVRQFFVHPCRLNYDLFCRNFEQFLWQSPVVAFSGIEL